MFFKKKQKPEKPEKPEEIKYQNRLKINFSNGDWLSYTVASKKNGQKILPWKNFYKWYFSRPQSKHFMMPYEAGETLIIRDRIIQFEVRVNKVVTP